MAPFWPEEFPMRRSRFTVLLAICIAICTAIVAADASLLARSARAADADSAGIRALIDDFTAAFNNHDSHAVAMCFTDDADFINVQQANSHGRKGIEEHFVPLFSGRLKDSHRTYTVKSLRSITPDVAAVTMDYVLMGTSGPNGSEVPPRKGLYDWIVVRQNGKWLISVLHESELGQPAAMVPVK
jgi:uncharacterized protein (TIGR02246 family)